MDPNSIFDLGRSSLGKTLRFVVAWVGLLAGWFGAPAIEGRTFPDSVPFPSKSDLSVAGFNESQGSAKQAELVTVLEANGSDTLNTVTLKFDQALDAATISPGGFILSPTLIVHAAQIDPDDSTRVQLVTDSQTPGIVYTIAISGVQGSSSAVLADDASAQFTAWRKVQGWVKTELWLNVTGEGVQSLLDDPRYQNGKPDRTYYVKGFQLGNDPDGENYGARLSGFFQPSLSGSYDFFFNNDDEAQVRLSTDASPDNLVLLGTFTNSPPLFDSARKVTSPILSRTQSYLLYGLLKQVNGDAFLRIGARRSGASSPSVPDLPVLGPESISTWVNPDLGKVEFTQQPLTATVSAGRRARFTVEVEAKSAPIYYQWQRNRVDIPGAIRSTYITPILKPENSGGRYRVKVEVGGVETMSAEASLILGANVPNENQPVVGINFVGGINTATGGRLLPTDVAGAAPQEHWNNLAGFLFEAAPLIDATGAPTPITFSAPINSSMGFSGTGSVGDADGLLMQGFVDAGAARGPIPYRLNQVPDETYQLLIYSIVADDARPALQSYSLSANAPPVTYYGHIQSGSAYVELPGFRRIDSTDPKLRRIGNYVLFEEVRPLADGTITILVSSDSPEDGNGHPPAVAGLQLIKSTEPPVLPLVMDMPRVEGEGLRVTWTGGRPPFQLRSRRTLAYGQWSNVGLPISERTILVPFDEGAQRFVQVVGQ